ncbi:CURVATURE THYLAKOID 1A [Spatholobus suberectus]|nr:CURVATURE THYLAKOID 1A [Spatholobus suberectus]
MGYGPAQKKNSMGWPRIRRRPKSMFGLRIVDTHTDGMWILKIGKWPMRKRRSSTCRVVGIGVPDCFMVVDNKSMQTTCASLVFLLFPISIEFEGRDYRNKVRPTKVQIFGLGIDRVIGITLFAFFLKWDAVENKSTVLLYGGGAIVAVWLSSILVSAINSVPLLPKIMELVGLGYTGWFVYRYLLFKSSRKELATDIEALKKKISGTE